MHHSWAQTDEILNKEIRKISHDLGPKGVSVAWEEEGRVLPRAPSALSSVLSRCSTPQVAWKPKEKKPRYPRCRFSDSGTRCAVFPCNTPSTYTGIGYVEETKTGRLVVKAPIPHDEGAREQFLIELEGTSPRRPLQSGRAVTAVCQRCRGVRRVTRSAR